MRIEELGRVRWASAVESVTPGAGRVHATAGQTGPFVHLDTHRPVPIPNVPRAAPV